MSGARLNALLLVGFLLLQALQLAAIPLLLLPRAASWGWLLLVPVLLTNTWWALMHEALHGHLLPHKRLTRYVGRLNAVLFGAPFDLLRTGHLLHHAFSRTPRERSEVYVAEQDSRAAFATLYYFRLLGGLYLFEMLGGLLFLLPRPLIRRVGARIAGPYNLADDMVAQLLAVETLAALRTDMLLTVALYAAAFAWYGQHGWMLALALGGRGLLISLMDNAFHYGTALGDARHARNLALPRWAACLILNFNLHGVHHQRAGVPWHQLPALHRQQGGTLEAGLLAAVLAQLRGPLPEHALPQAGLGR